MILQSARYIAVLIPAIVLTVFGLYFTALAQSEGEMTEREERLQAELEEVEDQIRVQERILSEEQRRATSLERDIAILNAQIERAQLNIQAKTIAIQQLGKDINARTQTIEELEADIENRKEHLVQLLKQSYNRGSYTAFDALLSNQSLSDFFVDLDSFQSIQSAIHETLAEIRAAQKQNTEQKEVLSTRQSAELDARKEIEAERRVIAQKEQEQQRLLSLSEAQADAYEQVLEERQREAARIRNELFSLRDTSDIPFGQALAYARDAERITGVRPAFLLGVFQQESGLRDGVFGVNVGTCNRPGDEQGWRDIMPGPNDNSWRDDQTIYQRIVNDLGRDPDTQPLSCPWQGGWGGAMGPAQFIPATWASFEDRIRSGLGIDAPDPWNPQHAFLASALYLQELGADQGGYTAERNAALQYYAGGNWNLPANAFYGDGVMQNAAQLQQNIDILDETP